MAPVDFIPKLPRSRVMAMISLVAVLAEIYPALKTVQKAYYDDLFDIDVHWMTPKLIVESPSSSSSPLTALPIYTQQQKISRTFIKRSPLDITFNEFPSTSSNESEISSEQQTLVRVGNDNSPTPIRNTSWWMHYDSFVPMIEQEVYSTQNNDAISIDSILNEIDFEQEALCGRWKCLYMIKQVDRSSNGSNRMGWLLAKNDKSASSKLRHDGKLPKHLILTQKAYFLAKQVEKEYGMRHGLKHLPFLVNITTDKDAQALQSNLPHKKMMIPQMDIGEYVAQRLTIAGSGPSPSTNIYQMKCKNETENIIHRISRLDHSNGITFSVQTYMKEMNATIQLIKDFPQFAIDLQLIIDLSKGEIWHLDLDGIYSTYDQFVKYPKKNKKQIQKCIIKLEDNVKVISERLSGVIMTNH